MKICKHKYICTHDVNVGRRRVPLKWKCTKCGKIVDHINLFNKISIRSEKNG